MSLLLLSMIEHDYPRFAEDFFQEIRCGPLLQPFNMLPD
jgi:hypothetical protein